MVQAQARGFSVARTKVGTNNPMRCTEAAAMPVGGDFVFSESFLPVWQWFICMALVGWALNILYITKVHGSVTISEDPMEY